LGIGRFLSQSPPIAGPQRGAVPPGQARWKILSMPLGNCEQNVCPFQNACPFQSSECLSFSVFFSVFSAFLSFPGSTPLPLVPKGRQSIARCVSPWNASTEPTTEPRKGGTSVTPSGLVMPRTDPVQGLAPLAIHCRRSAADSPNGRGAATGMMPREWGNACPLL